MSKKHPHTVSEHRTPSRAGQLKGNSDRADGARLCRRFKPGPIYTGKTVSMCLNCVAITYVLFMTSIFIMPTSYPTSSTTLNW